MTLKNKVTKVQLQRDLFGKMLAAFIGSESNQIPDVEKLLSYPLTPIPLAFCYLDGSVCKAEKSALVKCLGIKGKKTSRNKRM